MVREGDAGAKSPRWCFFRISSCTHAGSLSEDAPPPSARGVAMGQAASRHNDPVALARSLPVSVPVWGCRGNRSAQGDSSSGERVSATSHRQHT